MKINFLDGGRKSYENAEELKESANSLYQSTNKQIALFLLYTSCEELEKAIFCLLVHYKHLNQQQINSVFKLHSSKIILDKKIFIDKTFEYINGEYLLDGEPLKNMDFKKIIQQNDASWEKYKKERENCLYVEPQEKNWYCPKAMTNLESRWSETNHKWRRRHAFYKFLESNRLVDDLNITSLIIDDVLVFNGTGKAPQ